MITNPYAGVIGSDGFVPSHDPEGLWRMWGLPDVYMGHIAKGKHIPKLGDAVATVSGNQITLYLVHEINPITGVPVLTAANTDVKLDIFDLGDSLLDTTRVETSQMFMAYVDKSVTPYRLSVDARLCIPGSLSRTAKVFMGLDTRDTTRVISLSYDNAGDLTRQDIDLEPAYIGVNHSGKVVKSAYTNQDLMDGERLTLAVYNDEGHIVYKRTLVVENTAVDAAAHRDQKQIVGIGLIGPNVSKTVVDTVEYPFNLPISSINLKGAVYYSDGSIVEHYLNTSVFTILDMETYLANQPGESTEMVLRYKLADNETALSVVVDGTQRYTTKVVTFRTEAASELYGVKIYAYPHWDSISGMWKMRYHLYALDRQLYYDVTSLIEYNSNTPAFDGMSLTPQTFSVSLDLSKMDGRYLPYRHTQNISVSLLDYYSGQVQPEILWKTRFKTSDGYQPNAHHYLRLIHTGIPASAYQIVFEKDGVVNPNWMAELYALLHPLYNPLTEVSAPAVNRVYLDYVNDSGKQSVLINNPTATTVFNLNQAPKNHTNVLLRFCNGSQRTDLQLAAYELMCWHSDSSGHFI